MTIVNLIFSIATRLRSFYLFHQTNNRMHRIERILLLQMIELRQIRRLIEMARNDMEKLDKKP